MKRVKTYLIVFLLVLLSACGPKTTNTVTDFKVDGASVLTLMTDIGALTPNYITVDRNYSCPTRKFVEGEFSRALGAFISSMGTSGYKSSENDCDDYARAAAFFMGFLHHNTVHKISDTGIAFGEFYYTKAGAGGHAINVFLVHEEGNKVKILFYEPQTCSIVILSKEEIESCEYWRF